MATKTIMFNYEGSEVKMTVWDESKATLSDLYSKDLGKGNARRVMQNAIDYADAQGLTILLEVQRYRHPDPGALDNYQLTSFYSSLGFKKASDAPRHRHMLRVPSQEKHGL